MNPPLPLAVPGLRMFQQGNIIKSEVDSVALKKVAKFLRDVPEGCGHHLGVVRPDPPGGRKMLYRWTTFFALAPSEKR